MKLGKSRTFLNVYKDTWKRFGQDQVLLQILDPVAISTRHYVFPAMLYFVDGTAPFLKAKEIRHKIGNNLVLNIGYFHCREFLIGHHSSQIPILP